MALLFSLVGRRPKNLGVRDGRLAPCPSRPNCVCSDAEEDSHTVAAYRIAGAPESAWTALLEVLADSPRSAIVVRGDDYLHVECSSRLLGFVDDVEFHLRPDAGEIAVRSASRLGRSDLGVNRRRVEEIEERLRARGVLR